MLNQRFGNPWPIHWFPCEYVSVSPKETDEHAFLFFTQATPDQSSLGRVAFLQLDGLDADVAGVGFNPRLVRPLAGDLHPELVSFCAAVSTSVDGSGKYDVVAYSITS
jgi:hypothetical protein